MKILIIKVMRTSSTIERIIENAVNNVDYM